MPNARTPVPFSVGVARSADTKPIEFRSGEQISVQDRDLAAGAQASIHDQAELAGMDFSKGNWTYQQLVCEALPGYLLLLYENENGAGDRSLFSAAVPRGGKGRIRVIPIERRGFSLFSPASVNPITISAFNHIRDGEPPSEPHDWLATALCYAALAGARPMTSPMTAKEEDTNPALIFPPTIAVDADGDSTVRFVDVAAAKHPMQWALTFDGKGRLLKVMKFATPVYTVTPINPLPAAQASKPNN